MRNSTFISKNRNSDVSDDLQELKNGSTLAKENNALLRETISMLTLAIKSSQQNLVSDVNTQLLKDKIDK